MSAGATALRHVVDVGNFHLFPLLFAPGSGIKLTEQLSQDALNGPHLASPLYEASRKLAAKAVEMLLEARADVNQVNNERHNDRTALHAVCAIGRDAGFHSSSQLESGPSLKTMFHL